MRKPSINQDLVIGRLFRAVDNLLEEEGASPPGEPDDMDGESDPIDPIGAKGTTISKVATAYGDAIDKLKGAQAYLDGIDKDSDKSEVGVLVGKAKSKAKAGLVALQKAISDLDAL